MLDVDVFAGMLLMVMDLPDDGFQQERFALVNVHLIGSEQFDTSGNFGQVKITVFGDKLPTAAFLDIHFFKIVVSILFLQFRLTLKPIN